MLSISVHWQSSIVAVGRAVVIVFLGCDAVVAAVVIHVDAVCIALPIEQQRILSVATVASCEDRVGGDSIFCLPRHLCTRAAGACCGRLASPSRTPFEAFACERGSSYRAVVGRKIAWAVSRSVPLCFVALELYAATDDIQQQEQKEQQQQ